jgi:phospholipid-translocating ATPase
VIMIGSVTFFNDSLTNIVTITFSALIVCEILNVFGEVHKVNKKMVVSSLLTLFIYFLSIIALKEYFDVTYMTV